MIDSDEILLVQCTDSPEFRQIVESVVAYSPQSFCHTGYKTDWSIRRYASWWFSHFLEGQDSVDLPDLGRLPGVEVENV